MHEQCRGNSATDCGVCLVFYHFLIRATVILSAIEQQGFETAPRKIRHQGGTEEDRTPPEFGPFGGEFGKRYRLCASSIKVNLSEINRFLAL
ncbi:hypothetical protein SDC9_203681 [bioreactor metagenome]|uniref:Uncharacterized protein n=1 Tax=bioreactor metagenome TaxID=1076179 RepID=A0A645IXX3_9ZZZZ